MGKKRWGFFCIIVLIFIFTYFSVGNYFFNFALNAEKEKEFLQNNPHLQTNDLIDANREIYEKDLDRQFKERIEESKWRIKSTDDFQFQLVAHVYEQPSSKRMIVVHGYTSKADDMTRWIRTFYDEGYNVLAPDLRGHGESEGHYIGMG